MMTRPSLKSPDMDRAVVQDFKQERSSHQLQSAASSSIVTCIQVQFQQSDRLQSGAINVVRGPEGLYSDVLTIHVFIDENLLEESLNYNRVSLLIPDQLILLVV